MKIGVFGDSYADEVFADERPHAWPCIIGRELNAEVGYHAKSGTSMWWSYQNFKNNFEKYDVIVFCYTSAQRWPSLPEEIFIGRQFNIGYQKDNSVQDVLNPFFFSLFPNKLQSFINSCIQRDIVETCQREGKYLVQLIPFLKHGVNYKNNTDINDKHDFTVYPSEYPIMTGLDIVSHKEEVLVDNKKVNTCKYIANVGHEHRVCHLNNANNKIVADWVVDCIKHKKHNEYFAGEEYNEWVFFDVSDSKMRIYEKKGRRSE